MNTKSFAQQARKILMRGVKDKLRYWGFEAKGNAQEEPTAVPGGYEFRGEVFDDPAVPPIWQSLRRAIKQKGYDTVVEEAAYTWFNRVMAIRILSKNAYEPPMLDFADGVGRTPEILQLAKRGTFPFLNETEKKRLQRIITDGNRDTESFAILLIGYCHSHTLLKTVFGSIDDYTELLLPDDILAQYNEKAHTGLLDLVNTTDAISDEEYRKVELIGWLYQFYISEKKDEVFASFKKNKKAEAEDIPAATQIFTPNWIVKYMVQNTVGKIWLDLHPDSPLKANMKYLVESELYGDPIVQEAEQLKLLDPAVGSGHILVEGFDLLFDMYTAEYYPPGEAVECILRHNLFGLDIDKRAAQLAQFAILLKAAARYPDILKKGIRPNIHAMPEPRSFSEQDVLDFLGKDGIVCSNPLSEALSLMQQAQNLGSIMQFDLGKWDLKSPLVQDYLLEHKLIKESFFHDSVSFFQDILQFEEEITRAWGGWDWTKAKVGKFIAGSSHRLFEKHMDEGLELLQTASNLGFAVHLFYPVVTGSEVLALPEAEEQRQKDILKAISRFTNTFKECCEKIKSHFPNIRQVEPKAWITAPAHQKETISILDSIFGLKRYLTVDLHTYSVNLIQQRYTQLLQKTDRSFHEQAILSGIAPFIDIILVLSNRYPAVVANPPYMGQGTMNGALKDYANAHYPLSKSDLFAVFMEVCLELNTKTGLMGMINQHSWMFLSSFEKLREHLLQNYTISNMLHLGPRVFEELSGEVVQSTAFVLSNVKSGVGGTFYRLVDYKEVGEKERQFNSRNHEFKNIYQDDFSLIPGKSIAYWISKRKKEIFESATPLGEIVLLREGIHTANNELFLKFWFEPSITKFSNIETSISSIDENNKKWIPYNKGGTYRRWYGNNDLVISFDSTSREEMEKLKGHVRPSKNLYFLEGGTWSALTAGNFGVRYYPLGFLFDSKGQAVVANFDLKQIIALMNSCVAQSFYDIIMPTLDYKCGDVKKTPFIDYKVYSKSILDLSNFNIEKAKLDWDSHESSWEFQFSPLLNDQPNLQKGLEYWRRDVTKNFFQLHNNEETLNRIFIEIYGLQEELTPEVPLRDITILQEELNSKDLEALEQEFRSKGRDGITLPIRRDVVMQQFLSYLIGVCMGRYRLDQPGLHIAHPNPTDEEIANYTWNGQAVEIDDDAILPLMGSASEFPDDAVQRIKQLLDVIWGEHTRTENINFLQECLDMDLEKYMVKNFWKDHCKRYKKKPIYWLFTSPGGAFQVLVYMHRMNAFTVERIREKYLLPHIKHLRSKISMMGTRSAQLSSQEARQLDHLRNDLLECEQYEMVVKGVADAQIVFDLDDGVTVNYARFNGVVAPVK